MWCVQRDRHQQGRRTPRSFFVSHAFCHLGSHGVPVYRYRVGRTKSGGTFKNTGKSRDTHNARPVDCECEATSRGRTGVGGGAGVPSRLSAPPRVFKRFGVCLAKPVPVPRARNPEPVSRHACRTPGRPKNTGHWSATPQTSRTGVCVEFAFASGLLGFPSSHHTSPRGGAGAIRTLDLSHCLTLSPSL